MSDEPILREILARGEGFGHRQHVERNVALLNPKLLEHHYTHGVLFSDRARTELVDPDVRPRPALAA
jgi:hypothetical protein